MPALQGRYWLLTIPQHLFTPFIPEGVQYIKGQLEQGNNTEYLHWQLIVYFPKKTTLTALKAIFGNGIHAEITRSAAAEEYVWKDDTSIEGTRFELGRKSMKRNSSADWEEVRAKAKIGLLEDIPADIYVRHYSALKRIEADHCAPQGIEKTVQVYWGTTGTGKSRQAWQEAGLDAYPKDPNTKWWCGYRGQTHVIMDEFRGLISISNMLRWLDRYPVCVEIKGGQTVLKATKIWITSNVDPRDWYPELDEQTKDALLRRLNITHFS